MSTLVVGAGPYGMSLAAALHARGDSVVVVGRPFDLWQNHTLDATWLRSDVRSSVLPSAAPALSPSEDRISIETYRAYLASVLAVARFPVESQDVVQLHQIGDRFESVLTDGTRIDTERVVIATGMGAHKVSPLDRAIHAYDVARYRDLEDRRVLVVGGGQSAAEAVLHLRRRNDVTWFHRRAIRYYNVPLRLPRPLFELVLASPVLLHLLPSALVARGLEHFAGPTIMPDLAPLLAGVPRLAASEWREECDGSEGRFDVIVAATGYRFALAQLRFLDGALRNSIAVGRHGLRLDRHFQSTVPGLYFTGFSAEAAFGPAMRFVLGCAFSARRIATHLAR